MTDVVQMLLAWLAFPALLLCCSLGVGLVIARASRLRVPAPVTVAMGFSGTLVLAQFFTTWAASVIWALPVLAAIATLGVARYTKPTRAMLQRAAAPATAFMLTALLHGLPVMATGTPTFAGWIKLDDGASWLAFADRLVEHGRQLAGLAPSSYEAVLQINFDDGYPVGVFAPWGLLSRLIGIDPAWTLQPYLAAMAGLLALLLFQLVNERLQSRWLAVTAAVCASCSSLFLGYALWGGMKEVALAVLVVLACWLAAQAGPRTLRASNAVTMATVAAAILGVAGPSGMTWLALPLLVVLLRVGRAQRRRVFFSYAAALAAAVLVMSWPIVRLVRLDRLSSLAGYASSNDDIGNLWGPLDRLQVAGIWPVGDFRMTPSPYWVAAGIAGGVLLLALLACARSVRDRAVALPLMLVLGAAMSMVTSFGNPWIGGKALAIASPMVLVAAFVGAGLVARKRASIAAALLGALIAGVGYSYVAAYRDVSLAPYDQLRELEFIGQHAAGQTPALMLEYSPYGVRHFLRDLDPEGAGELRRNLIPLLTGKGLERGVYADIDEFQPNAINAYRTLVLRRSDVASRPPSNYELVWAGRYYEEWRRRDVSANQHIALGDHADAAGIVRCDDLLLQSAGAKAVITAQRPEHIIVPLDRGALPLNWWPGGEYGSVIPHGAGVMTEQLEVTEPGRYQFWLAGSFSGRMTMLIDGREVSTSSHRRNWPGNRTSLTSHELSRGLHSVTLVYSEPWWQPGSSSQFSEFGPLTAARATAAETAVTTLPMDRIGSLCGQKWDWIEVVR